MPEVTGKICCKLLLSEYAGVLELKFVVFVEWQIQQGTERPTRLRRELSQTLAGSLPGAILSESEIGWNFQQ